MKHSRTRFALARAGALCAFAFLSVAVACEARLPTSAEVDAMNVEGAERAAISAKLLAEKINADRIYTVDGKTVSAAEAHAIAANKIATVNIRGRKAALDKDEVLITTLDHNKRIPSAEELANLKLKLRMRMAADTGYAVVPDKRQLSKKSFDGVLMVDGVVTPSSELAELKKDQIESIEVIKGAAATRLSSDPAALNGIISVKMKPKQ